MPGGGVDAAQETLRVLEGELASVQELGFAFRRASSRLVEMGGVSYHEAHADAFPDARPLPTTLDWGDEPPVLIPLP